MKLAKTKRNRPARPARQLDLFGGPPEPVGPKRPRPAPTRVEPLEFQGQTVRVVIRDGEPWWSASDVCRVLGVANVGDALSRLDEDERRDIGTADITGRTQMMAWVSESGLYALILTSRKPEARRFRRWVTQEVLPEIRRTGRYEGPDSSRVRRKAKQMGCDLETAQARVDNIDVNKAMAARMAAEGAKPRHFQANHNGTYKGQLGASCGQVKRTLGLWRGQTPLDRFSPLALAANSLSKFVADRVVRDNAVPLVDQPLVYEQMARNVSADTLRSLGEGYQFGISEDAARGKIVDAVRTLPGPAAG